MDCDEKHLIRKECVMKTTQKKKVVKTTGCKTGCVMTNPRKIGFVKKTSKENGMSGQPPETGNENCLRKVDNVI